jgi:hypothetical protein
VAGGAGREGVGKISARDPARIARINAVTADRDRIAHAASEHWEPLVLLWLQRSDQGLLSNCGRSAQGVECPHA